MVLTKEQRDMMRVWGLAKGGVPDATYIRCECGYTYPSGEGWHDRCPKCHPNWCAGSALHDPHTFPGHDWFWSMTWDRWELLEQYAVIHWEKLRVLLPLLPRREKHEDTVCSIRKELERLGAIVAQLDAPHAEVAEREGRRATQLADECGKLKTLLELKRIQCDELRDELEMLQDKYQAALELARRMRADNE